MKQKVQTKKFLFAILLSLVSTVGTSSAQMNGYVGAEHLSPVEGVAYQFYDLLKSKLDEAYTYMLIQEQSHGDNEPDYKAASLYLQGRIRNARVQFEESKPIQGINDFLNWYDVEKANAVSDSQKAEFQKNYDEKKKEIDQYRSFYLKAAADFIVLDGYLNFPMSKFEYVRNVDVDATGRTIYQFNPFKKSWKSAKRWKKEAINAETVQLFGLCKTQLCVSKLAEDYLVWIQEINKAIIKRSIPLDGIEPFVGPDLIDLGKIQSTIDLVVQEASKGLPEK